MLALPFSITLTGNTLLLALFLCFLVGCSILFYRFTIPTLPRIRKISLSVIRSITLVILLFLLFEPLLRLIQRDVIKPSIAFLIDNSKSMTLPLSGPPDLHRAGNNIKTGSEAVRQFLKGYRLNDLPSNSLAKHYPFSSALNKVKHGIPDSLTFDGDLTDISKAFDGLKDHLVSENIQAVVLVSDGNYTTGKNPLYDAESIGIPIYTVGVGDTNEQKDVLIEKVLTNELTYAESRVPVDVTIKNSGYHGEHVEVVLNEGTAILDRKVITLLNDTRFYTVKLYAEPKEEGMKKYTVRIDKLPGELTDKNNLRSFFIKVMKSKLRVLLVAGSPNPDVSAIRQALSEEKNFSVLTLIQKSAQEFYERTFSRAFIDSADCIVMIGFPSSATSPALLQEIHDIINQQKKPVFFINGKTLDYLKLGYIESILPFSWSSIHTTEVEVFPKIIERQNLHPLVNLDRVVTTETWHMLPPIFKHQTIFRAKPESEVLASVRLPMEFGDFNEPLLLIRNVNRQKTLGLTGYGLWRWRLLAQGNPQTERFLPLLMSSAVRWLTTKDEGKHVTVTPVKDAFTSGEAIEFMGQVYDEQFRPVDDANLSIDLVRGNEKFQLALNAIGNGRYEGFIENLGEGEYTFSAKATKDGKVYGEDKGRFDVGQLNFEFLRTTMNKQLLEQISFTTGGKYFDITNADGVMKEIASQITLTPKENVRVSEIELWNWQYLAAITVLLFGIEWYLRKRYGMI